MSSMIFAPVIVAPKAAADGETTEEMIEEAEEAAVDTKKSRWTKAQGWYKDVFAQASMEGETAEEEPERVMSVLIANWSSVATTGETLTNDAGLVAKAEELGEPIATGIATEEDEVSPEKVETSLEEGEEGAPAPAPASAYTHQDTSVEA